MSGRQGVAGKENRKASKSRIRVLMTALTLTVFVIFAVVAFVLLLGSQNRLADKSKDEMIQMVCEDASSSAASLIPFVQPMFFKSGADEEGLAKELPKYMARELTDGQKEADAALRDLVNQGIMGTSYIVAIMPPFAPISDKPLVMISSDESLVYNWAVPDDLYQAIQDGTSYIYKPDGIPELGIEKDGLYVIASRIGHPLIEGYWGIVNVISIEDKVAAIDSFLSNERSNSELLFALVMIGCLIAAFLITFFILSRLIRSRITRPIDELAVAADDIMDGKLDVNIQVHEGGDFQVLESAFKEMAESIRMMIERSTDEE
jgi:methyl-accepting chemotaxis protein